MIQTVADHDGIYQVPSNVSQFLYQYRFSKFVECNRTLLEENIRLFNGNYSQNLAFNDRMMPVLTRIKSKFEQNIMNYWPSGGTLIGMLYK